ncbi:4-hydroxybenzoate polyprenyltransferase [Georgenia yuyongxinii]|uniref:4-hydroxybenzoate polyprenyltransferase n=2 Tax=Georgenia yuyongxinii TaxID=2589797 RepID=A0A5B8CBV7_9MICO|nr:4-hydroxybenzoate polyprenyltransferase [Georgenia yuyongxinii]
MAGAAAAGWPARRGTAALAAGSVCLYWAGMALNDYADRDLDRIERPERPIPSGRVRPRHALALAAALTVAGLGLGASAGRRALAATLPLAGTVWAYDLVAKRTVLGPVVMGAARGLDVLVGATGHIRPAVLPALAVAGHTAAVTALSRGEVHGTRPLFAASALACTVATAALAGAGAVRGQGSAPRVTAVALAALYALSVGRAQAGAVLHPNGPVVRRATGAGIRGLIPLQAALAAGTGSLGSAAALLVAGPLTHVATRKISPT